MGRQGSGHRRRPNRRTRPDVAAAALDEGNACPGLVSVIAPESMPEGLGLVVRVAPGRRPIVTPLQIQPTYDTPERHPNGLPEGGAIDGARTR